MSSRRAGCQDTLASSSLTGLLQNVSLCFPYGYDKCLHSSRLTNFAMVFLVWLLPILEEGNRDDLHCNDLYPLPSYYRAHQVLKPLSVAWTKELGHRNSSGRTPSLLNGLRKAFGLQLFLLGILLFVEMCIIKMMQPLLLGHMLHNFHGKVGREGSYFAGGLVLTLIISPLIRRPLQYNTQLLGMKLRVAVSSLVYKKALKLSLESLKLTSLGQITSLIGTDVNHLDSAVTSFHQLWIAPCQLIIAISIIYYYLGLASLSGVAVFLLVISIQGLMGLAYQYYCSQQAKDQDQRLGIIAELLQKIRLIKMHTWEPVYSEMVDEARTSELSWIRKKIVIMAVNKCLYYTSLKLTIFLTLLVYFMSGGQITAEKVYVVIAVYNNIRYPMANCFPAAIQHAAEGITVINRLKRFLLLEEIPARIIEDNSSRASPEVVVRLENVSLKLNSVNQDPFMLNNISFELKQGELLVIVGPVGSGKSTVLKLILNELSPSSGLVWTHGSIAYCSQESWILPGTIMNNITFGHRFDRKLYDAAIEACALRHDFAQFSHGDQTIIGEGGISLSGGQQLRLALLRSVYANADIYLLDLPLSCVDSSVRRHLIDTCINGVLREKSRIIVTNEIQLLQSASRVLVLRSGTIEASGTYDELLEQGFDFQSYTQDAKTINENNIGRNRNGTGNGNLESASHFPKINKQMIGTTEKSPLLEKSKKNDLVRQSSEEMSFGQIKFSTLWSYVSAGDSTFNFLSLVTLWLITQALNNAGDYWIKFWTKLQQKLTEFPVPNNSSSVSKGVAMNLMLNWDEALFSDTRVQVYVFAGLLGSLLMISFVKNFIYFRMTLAASRKLHEEMYFSLVRTSMKFFNENPSGRTLARFSRDISVIDSTLPNCLYETIEISLSVIGYLIIITLICPLLLPPASGLLILLYFTRRYNLKTSIAVKRIESNLRSPILSHLNTTIHGLTTIRAFRKESQFVEEFEAHLDLHSKAWLGFVATTRWLGLVLDWTAVVFLTMVIGIVLISNLDGPEIGLIISSVLPLATMLQWVTRQSAELENQLVSVERVEQLSHLKPEVNSSEFWNESHSAGTEAGEISFSNVTLEYHPGTPVLRTISFNVKPNEKIGIIGRTGAGKSSILNALFRLVDISSGEITIDGVNINSLDLYGLRSRIGIIPQDPLLVCRKSIRDNLDPFNLHTDLTIWNILELVQLRKFVEEAYGSLDAQLSDCSVGERQLLCFARAMLMNCKILVLDEITSNLDPRTEAIIQNLIRDKTECTVLSIAHKLGTVLENDRVMVLEDGVIQEFDDPAKLLSNPESKLSYYVRESIN